jgi:hypothetical protein
MSDSLSVSVQTRINAPPEKVWQVLTDFGGYRTWHPVLTLEPQAGRHFFQLEPLADGTTEFTESEVFTGRAAAEVIGGQLPELHATYETFAAAFKKRVEEGVSGERSSR